MNTSGKSGCFFLTLEIISKILSVVVLEAKALISALVITEPSAIGSLNGIPISIKAVPASIILSINISVDSKSGSPAVTKAMNAFLLNTFLKLLINLNPQISSNWCTILISSTR